MCLGDVVGDVGIQEAQTAEGRIMTTERDRLQLERNKSLHEREWKVQHGGWILGVAILAAALAGLLGSGPLSTTTATSASGSVRVLYDRFVHGSSEVLLRVRLEALEGTQQTFALKLPHSFLERARILRIDPEPVRSEFVADATLYEFERAVTADRASVDFHLEFHKFGSAPGSVELKGNEAALFTQFVYP
jgi:hypothetical protein